MKIAGRFSKGVTFLLGAGMTLALFLMAGADCTSTADTSVSFNNRGAAKGTKGDLPGATADLNMAITLNPTNAAAYRNRGADKGLKGDLDGVIADCNKAIQLRPGYASAYLVK